MESSTATRTVFANGDMGSSSSSNNGNNNNNPSGSALCNARYANGLEPTICKIMSTPGCGPGTNNSTCNTTGSIQPQPQPTTVSNLSSLARWHGGCGPGTNNNTCSTTGSNQPQPQPQPVGCGPGTDNSTCSELKLPTPCTIQTAYVIDRASTDPLCKQPEALANVDRSAANEGDTITLDGSKGTDSGGEHRLFWHWEQVPTGGPTVELSDPNVATPTFTAPKDIQDSTKLTFRLVVTDNLDVNDKAYHGNPASTP